MVMKHSGAMAAAPGASPRSGGIPAAMVKSPLIHHEGTSAAETPSAAARHRLLSMRGGEPFLLADWERALMLHYEVSPEKLQPFVPFELDVRDGKAYVSLVAFTMRGMRPRRGGRFATLAFKPIATHGFLNVRTYVKHRGESGIHFLAEWLPNKLAVLLGRPVFGLPYRLGKLDYRHHHERGRLRGCVLARRRKSMSTSKGRVALRYRVALPMHPRFRHAERGSLTEFLMERYTAFTTWLGWKRCFRIWHEPWPQCEVEAAIEDDSLMHLTGEWARHARFIGANYSPGLRDVWMSRPTWVRRCRHEPSTKPQT
jgi:uncharacterized protein YqjF (DUF2071 family)